MQNSFSPDGGSDSGKTLYLPVCEMPVTCGESNKKRADSFKAIVNPETGKVFSIVSKDYKLIKHEDTADRLKNVLSEHPELGKYKTKTEFYNEGARMRRTYCFYESEVEIDKGDIVNPELHLTNSYDRSWPFTVLLGAFRLICGNGLVVGIKFLHLRKRHVYDFREIDLEKHVSTALARFNLQTDQWVEWSKVQLTQKTYDRVRMAMQLGKNALELINERIFQDVNDSQKDGFPIMSLWAFYNILSWYITHRTVSLNHRVELEKRLRTAMKHIV